MSGTFTSGIYPFPLGRLKTGRLTSHAHPGYPCSMDRLSIDGGVVYIYICRDIGLSINLDMAESCLQGEASRPQISRQRIKTEAFGYKPRPVRFCEACEVGAIRDLDTAPVVEVTLWDFGVVSFAYRIDLPKGYAFEDLPALSEALFDEDRFEADARLRSGRLLARLEGVIDAPEVSSIFEDHFVFAIDGFEPPLDPAALLAGKGELIARISRSETGRLSRDIIEDSLANHLSFDERDLAVVDWNASLLLGPDMEDSRAVLEFSLVQLLEMRVLDLQLTASLDDAYTRFSKLRPNLRIDLRHIARLSIDAASVFEAVRNGLKLVEDQYLASLHAIAARRFQLEVLNESIVRKLGVLESIYEKLADLRNVTRAEVLEVVIILLIAFEIIQGFFAR